MRKLRGKVAVVTGAGSGIGRATALALAGQGVGVAVCDVNEIAAKDTANAIVGDGGVASVHAVDVSSEEAMRALPGEVLTEHAVVDVVINNAAIAMLPTPTVDVPLDLFRRVMEVNFWGVVHGSLLFLPHLLERPEANLVNVASNASLMAYSRIAPYTAAKFGVRGFTETLRMELRPTPVRVTVVCPGLTKTPMFGQSPIIDPEKRQALQGYVDRIWGRPPEAVARAIVEAVERDRPRVLVGPDSVAMDWLSRALPGAHSRLLAPGVNYFMGKFARRL